ncbi:MAG: signal peptidase I [Clostridiales bacterium]|nr:signal peptidase I [Clostridiales bacterium]
MSKEQIKKILGIASKVVTWIVVAFAVFMMIFTIFSVRTFDNNERSIFGRKFYIVQTNSMSLSEKNKDDEVHFDAGDIVIIKNVDDPYSLQAGDIISFISQNSVSFNETVTHRIREVKYNEKGRVEGYVTYGTNTDTNDEQIVEPEYVLGVYSGKLPKLGHFFQFLKSTPGYIVCILVPFLLLILYQGVNTVLLFKKYQKEKTADLQAEREQIAEERKQSEQMLRELEALREKLAQSGVDISTPASAQQPTTEQESFEEKQEIFDEE